MRARPAPQVSPRVPDIRLGQIEPEHRQPRPALLDEIEEAAGAAADVDQPQSALVAAGECFRQRRQRLPPHRVRRALEQHLDLGVVAVGGVRRSASRPTGNGNSAGSSRGAGRASPHSALRGSRCACGARRCREGRGRTAASGRAASAASRRDPRAGDRCRPRHWRCPARTAPPCRRRAAARGRFALRIGWRLRRRNLAVAPPHLLGEPAHDLEVPGVPGDARQLRRRIGNAGCQAR